ncbi:MAG: hypothetical protein R2837_00875 [Aliarcobacter sp.]
MRIIPRRVGSKIKIAYNEFIMVDTSKFMIRPAFEQIIDCNLSDKGQQ